MPNTPATPTISELTAIFGKTLPSADSTLTDRLDTVCRFVRYGDLPDHFDTIAYGMLWARATGRVGGQVEMRLRALNRRNLAGLVITCAAACRSIGEVPTWLNNRYL